MGSSSKKSQGSLQANNAKMATFLSSRKVSHGHNLGLASKFKSADGHPILFFFKSRKIAHHVSQHGHVQQQSFCKVLVVLGNVEVIMPANHAIQQCTSSPVMSFSRILFPAPLGSTKAIQRSKSTPKSTFS